MARTVKLTIDGRSVEVEGGTTVLQAAQQAGVFVPTLCADPALRSFGACRLCIVEIESLRGLPTACTTPVSEGMRVRTTSPQIDNERRMIVELLLSDHPSDCLTCVKNTRCELQTVAAYIGVHERRIRGERRAYDVDNSNPFYGRDLEKCILCGKCVRACDELQARQAIHFGYRGFATKITTLYDMPLWDSTCESCGRCVDMCPTAALFDKAWLTSGLPTSETRSICSYCGVGCGLVLETRNGRVISVRGDRDNPTNRGHTCVKGRFGHGYIHSPDRLTHPLIRRSLAERLGLSGPASPLNDRFIETDWETALDLVAETLATVRRQSGPEALAFVTSAKCTNEENYLIQKLARGVVGTHNIDHCARL
jgi:predicted molibdopterin-dependent oxidoreductase YjgC